MPRRGRPAKRAPLRGPRRADAAKRAVALCGHALAALRDHFRSSRGEGASQWLPQVLVQQSLAAEYPFTVRFGTVVAYITTRTVGTRLGNGQAVICVGGRRRRRVLGVLQLPVTTDVLLLYPGVSLQEQIGLWAMRHPQQHVEASSWWSSRDLERLLRHARTALIDASEDPERARGVFAGGRPFGAARSPCMRKRRRTPWRCSCGCVVRCFLLGPLFDEQWEEYFAHPRPARQRAPLAPIPVRQRLRLASLLDGRARQQAWWSTCVRAGLNWRKTDMN